MNRIRATSSSGEAARESQSLRATLAPVLVLAVTIGGCSAAGTIVRSADQQRWDSITAAMQRQFDQERIREATASRFRLASLSDAGRARAVADDD